MGLRRSVSEVLDASGLLLLTDPEIPSLAGLVAEEPIRGSWWGHPRGQEIFRQSCLLEEDTDVVSLPLLGGKVTFVHRRHWGDLLAIGRSRAPWQMTGLPAADRACLEAMEETGSYTLESAGNPLQRRARSQSLKRLGDRLLLVTGQEHSASGAHLRVAWSWAAWALDRGVDIPGGPAGPVGSAVADAQSRLEAAASVLSPLAPGRFPWRSSSRKGPGKR